MLSKKNKAIIPLPYPIYYWTVFSIGSLGLLDAIYLSVSHYRVYTDITYVSFCTLTRAINCDTVSQSPYSVFMGIPVPIWGIAGYAFFLAALAFARKGPQEKRRIWTLLWSITILYSLSSLVLALISTFSIKSLCLMCLASYAINFALVYFIWLVRNRFHVKGFFSNLKDDLAYLYNHQRRKSMWVLIVLGAAIGAYELFAPHYWELSPPINSHNIPHSTAKDFPPWIGAKNPVLTIDEFVDYQCFQCRKNHYLLRALIAQHPAKIRLVHHNYPLDEMFFPMLNKPFHTGSGNLALIAIYAALTKNFWQINDKLFEIGYHKQVVTTQQMAKKLGWEVKDINRALLDKNVRLILKNEMKEGGIKKIIGTPTYIIKGKIYRGHIPYEVLKQVLN